MSKHLKRLVMPRSWALPKKTHTWVVKPSPGAHAIEKSLPLLVILRDILGYCKNKKEGMSIISRREIKVDGKVVTNEKFPVGPMDVVSIPKIKENFRVLLDKNGKLRLVSIKEKDAEWKLARIENKTTIAGSKVQLNMHDGRNILLKKSKYRTGDVLKIEVPAQKIIDAYSLEKGNTAFLIGGKHVGELGLIEKYDIVRNPKENIVGFREGFSTVKKHVFMVGREKPEVTLP
ncbi:MAG: 30S ribosomal protein S4e [Thermoplasmata archaeon]|nr:30S ribosomal protein S4e [Thermoplasmata archaeon]